MKRLKLPGGANLFFCLVVAKINSFYIFRGLTASKISVFHHRIIVVFGIRLQQKGLGHASVPPG